MILTTKQEEGLRIAVERYRNNEPYTVIGGYAGTGKSTLIKFIIAALDIRPDDVCYVAYTGKAATVLQQKGCPNATTAHQLLYYAKPMPNGTFKFFPKSKIDYKIVVIDEISMLPRPMWEELLKHRVYIIAAGDPGQLPPVDKNMDNGKDEGKSVNSSANVSRISDKKSKGSKGKKSKKDKTSSYKSSKKNIVNVSNSKFSKNNMSNSIVNELNESEDDQ